MEATNDVSALSEVLHWACSTRGANNFYGRILNGCGRKGAPGLNTVGVTLTPEGKYILLCDIEWFTAQDRPFQILAIVHEAAHIVLRHIERSLHIKKRTADKERFARLKMVINVAMDMAANDIAVRPFINNKQHGKAFQPYKDVIVWPEQRKYPLGKSFEEYLAMLLKDLEEHGFSAGGGSKTANSGQKGSESSENNPQPGEKGYDPQEDSNLPQWFKDLLKKQSPVHVELSAEFDSMTDAEVERTLDKAKRESKKIVRHALEQTQKQRGTVPAHLQSILQDLLKEPKIPWELVFKGMLKSAISSKLTESMVMPNISMLHLEDDDIEPYPGYQKDLTFHIAACVDTSGSVSDEEFKKLMAELKGVLDAEQNITVQFLMFDAAIQHETLLSEEVDDSLHRNKYTRYGYGGTDFRPALKRILHKDTDGDWIKDAKRIHQRLPNTDLVVMLTDGGAPVASPSGPIPDYEPPCPIIWVITPHGHIDKAMGNRVIEIPD